MTSAPKRPRMKSGLEYELWTQITEAGLDPNYEGVRLKYTVPARAATYRPDYPLANGVIIEGKGRLSKEDRDKHLLIKELYPDLDIRFVFDCPDADKKKLPRAQKTHGEWCRENGFLYSSKGIIPPEWLTSTTPKST